VGRGLGKNEEEIIARNKRASKPRSSTTTITLSLDDQDLNSALGPDTIKHKFEESIHRLEKTRTK